MEKRNEAGQTLQEFLDSYDDSMFRHPSNTVDMILMTVHEGVLKILLVKRRNHPFIGDWALPGGFIEFDEDMDEAVKRELQEETHIEKYTYFRQLYTLGNADRDPRTRVITTAYLSLTPSENVKRAKPGDDAQETAWFEIKKVSHFIDEKKRESTLSLNNRELGLHMEFSILDTAQQNYIKTRSRPLDTSNCCLAADHIKVINMAMDQVQHRAASTGILFNVLPKECTLRQIQTAYEAVIGHKTDTGNFRRDIRKMLVDTHKKVKVNGRMSELYTFNPMYTYLKENL